MTLRLKRDRRRAPTYDAVQMAAVLTTCGTCGRAYFMTTPGPVCIRCRQATSERTP